TLGGCGIWYLYDVVVLAAGDFRDGDGRRVIRWEVGEGGPARLPRSVEDLEERLQGLETQVSELAERLDFTERLLAQVRERGALRERLRRSATRRIRRPGPPWCRPPRTCSGRATSSSKCSRRPSQRSGCAARGRRSWRCSSRRRRATPWPRSRRAR